MRIGLVPASAVLFASMAFALPAQTVPRVYSPQESGNTPQIDLWLDQTSLRPGDRVAPHFVTEPGAFVTIVRVTSDGQLQVLYPRRPRDQHVYTMGQFVNDRVNSYSGDRRFEVYESQGIGFVFAIASFDKFDFRYFTTGGEWSINRLANDSRYGDPFEIVRRFIDRTLDGGSDFSMDYVSYEVDNTGPRSRYASRYGYTSYNDYYESCLGAFGYSYYSYCGRFYPGYYGQGIIVSQPGRPAPNVPSGPNYAGKQIRPVTGDPMVHGAPTERQPITEGRLPNGNAAEEAALAAHRDRLERQATPRDRSVTGVDTRPMDNAPRVYTSPVRTEPVQREPDRAPMMRADPRVEQPRVEQPRVEHQRAEPRPVAQPRVEVRNEPPAQHSEPAPRPTAAPAEKDHGN